ncbi:hypothetical protein CPB97_008227 [Podila verticillata]|nr:hypothetical protein CPB97_008227 [Podila verticillata]
MLSTKKLIKSEKAPESDYIPADKLTLWRVSIAVADDDNDDDLPILLNNISKNDKKKLKAVTQKVFDGYGPDERTIHVIVQRPPPDNADTRCFIDTLS